jgi:hypothetical protein
VRLFHFVTRHQVKSCVVAYANDLRRSSSNENGGPPQGVRVAQQIIQFALRSLTHYALNHDGRATGFTLSTSRMPIPARVTPTLMPVQPANAVCSGHRHAITGWRESSSACLSLHRARITRHHVRISPFHFTRPVMPRFQRAMSALKPRRFAPRWGEPSRGFRFAFFGFSRMAVRKNRHRADTCTRSSRQASARFRRNRCRTRQLSARSTR